MFTETRRRDTVIPVFNLPVVGDKARRLGVRCHVSFEKWVSAPSFTPQPVIAPGPSALVCGTRLGAWGLSFVCTWGSSRNLAVRPPGQRGLRGGDCGIGGAIQGYLFPPPWEPVALVSEHVVHWFLIYGTGCLRVLFCALGLVRRSRSGGFQRAGRSWRGDVGTGFHLTVPTVTIRNILH